MDSSSFPVARRFFAPLRTLAAVACLGACALPAAAQAPAMDVSTRAVVPGAALGVTAVGNPGEHYVILGSATGGGLTFAGQALSVGADSRVLAAGLFDGTGRAVHMVVPPFWGTVLDRYYLQVAASPSFTFDPLHLSDGIVVLNADLLTGLVVGPAGPAGSAGPMGATGPTGPAGPAGAMGAAGSRGADGLPGVAGLMGPAGVNGMAGAVGPAGPAGAMGPVGPMGPIGANGPAGPMGPAGSLGPQGPTGAQGMPGSPGANGANGATGATGARGSDGISSVVNALHLDDAEDIAGGAPVTVLTLKLSPGHYLLGAKISASAVTDARIVCQLEQEGAVLDRAALSLFDRAGADEEGTLTLMAAAAAEKGGTVTVSCSTSAKTSQVLDRTLTATMVGGLAVP